MYSISDLKKELLIELDGVPYKVIETQHINLGRGGAVMRTRIKNLLNGSVLEKTFRPAEKISPTKLTRRPSQYLYAESTSLVFMDQGSYEQYSLPSSLLSDQVSFLKDGQETTLLVSDGKVIAAEVPNSVELSVTASEPGVKGDSANAPTKTVTLETGLKVSVPLFIKPGDILKIDTRTGSYLGRAK